MLFRNSRFYAGDKWFIFTSLRCRTCRAPGETDLSPRHVCGCSVRVLLAPFHDFLVLSSLFLRHGSQIQPIIHQLENALAVATLVITVAGPLRINTLDCC